MVRVSLTSLFLLAAVIYCASAQNAVNLEPVIGILAIPSDYSQYAEKSYNYMAASYVKYVESAGARVVPIQWDLPLENLTSIMRKLNGFLLTGGSADHVKADNKTLTPFGKAVENVINNVIQFNKEGTYYPLWGTCMGFQLISCIIAGQSSGNYNCLYSQPGFLAVRKNMTFTQEALAHPIFSKMPDDIHKSFETEGITFFNMHYTVQRNLWEENYGLLTNFTRLTYVSDDVGTDFGVLIAGTKYPIFGSQFHPEKSAFEWNEQQDIPHSYEAIVGAQIYANFFVDEARKNSNKITNADFDEVSIYNYNPIQIPNDTFDQVYIFKRVSKGSPYRQMAEDGDIDTQVALEFLDY